MKDFTCIPELKFRCFWNDDAEKDLKALWGNDVVKELVSVFLDEAMSQTFAHIATFLIKKGIPVDALQEWAKAHPSVLQPPFTLEEITEAVLRDNA